MAFALLFLVLLGIRLSSLTSPPETELHEAVCFLRERVNMLENLAIQQDLAIKQLTAVAKQFEEERQHTATLTAEWEKAQQQWEIERHALVTLLKDKTNKDCNSDTPNTSVHDVGTRSDDVNSLEPVVTQMAQRLTEVSAEVQTLKNSHSVDIQALRDANVQQDKAIQEAGSSIYVRWGNSVCPSSDSLVYAGVVGGSYNGSPGAATNHLCLTMSPVLSDHSIPGSLAYLYGGEYWTYDGTSHLKDTVCAVCRTPRPTVIMVPGTNRCEAGWTTEYSGYLMAGVDHDAAGTEYICVDSQLVSRPGSDAHFSCNHLFFTVTRCGSLPCGPYVNNKIVTCVVCSK